MIGISPISNIYAAGNGFGIFFQDALEQIGRKENDPVALFKSVFVVEGFKIVKIDEDD